MPYLRCSPSYSLYSAGLVRELSCSFYVSDQRVARCVTLVVRCYTSGAYMSGGRRYIGRRLFQPTLAPAEGEKAHKKGVMLVTKLQYIDGWPIWAIFCPLRLFPPTREPLFLISKAFDSSTLNNMIPRPEEEGAFSLVHCFCVQPAKLYKTTEA